MTTISVAMPAYNEENAIGSVVAGFTDIAGVDEVVVADNNSTDRTAEIADENGAKVVQEERQGYGYAMHRAMSAATGDIVVTAESDGTYHPADIHKLLAYADDFDIVLGDRTNRGLIHERAKMGFVLRYGNKGMGRLIQILFDGPRLTDVGCSYRLFHRPILDDILSVGVAGADRFSPQLIIEGIQRDADIIQVPVRYRERTGDSKLTSSLPRSIPIGLDMLTYITCRRAV